MKKEYNILLVESSFIVLEGLTNIIKSIDSDIVITAIDSLGSSYKIENPGKYDIVIVNPIFLNNCNNAINKFSSHFKDNNLIGLVVTVYDRMFRSLFQDYVYINDSKELICNTISKYLTIKNGTKSISGNLLTDRETDVLKLLAKGKSNKEIADELFISIHTVVTHRKNLGRKINVKSTAAMAIYAVANNIIDLNESLKSLK
ncbi:MAG: response regulator transcription factor [Bacteroidota bacterium]|nr:response regulator transcription factor [Bacteroidota bacterium]